MSMLLALPLVPLAAAAWLVLSSRSRDLPAGWLVALAAAFPVVMAVVAAPDRVSLPGVLVLGTSALVLDSVARAALLLFGGLWLSAGLLLTRSREPGPTAFALLVALAGATLLALAEGGPLVYLGMLWTGYGLYVVMASESITDWRRAGRALIVLLVLSDLLVFEVLLSATASPAADLKPAVLVMGLIAVILRGGIPPAHGWLPPALMAASTAGAMLLVVLPAAAFFGILKLLPAGAPQMGVVCALLGIAGAVWAAVAGLAQADARATLGYAVAATAALLLAALPAGAGPEGQLAWLTLALLACCAALPLVALQHAGWFRDIAIAAAVLLHGLAGGHLLVHAVQVLPIWAAALLPGAAIAATFLLTLTVRRTPAVARDDASVEKTRLAYAPVILAGIGLGFAWAARPPVFASSWILPIGVTLALVIFRLAPARAQPAIPPGDLLVLLERTVGFVLRWLQVVFVRYLPRFVRRLEARVLSLWDGDAWSRRVHRLDIRLRTWPATSLMMILFALSAAFLLAK